MVLDSQISLIPFTKKDFPMYQILMQDQSLVNGLQISPNNLSHTFQYELDQTVFNQILFHNTCIGLISCYQVDQQTLDIAYGLHKNYRGQGLMQKALVQQFKLLPKGYTLQAEILAENIASKKLMTRLAFQKTTQLTNFLGQQISIYQKTLV